jgi:hypothetical protein
LANFDVVLVGDSEMIVIDDRLPVVGTDRGKALADWRNQVMFVGAGL